MEVKLTWSSRRKLMKLGGDTRVTVEVGGDYVVTLVYLEEEVSICEFSFEFSFDRSSDDLGVEFERDGNEP